MTHQRVFFFLLNQFGEALRQVFDTFTFANRIKLY